VHLTKDSEDGKSAKKVLHEILNGMKLKCGKKPVSAASFQVSYSKISSNSIERKEYFNATCFTETPINELHCFFEINDKSNDYKPYGLVFHKDPLRDRGVSPAIYLNNYTKEQTKLLSDLSNCLISNHDAAKSILPLITTFGHKVDVVNSPPSEGIVDFIWEREWRFPFSKGDFKFELDDIYLGLCPNDKIDEFELEYPGLSFIDPYRNINFYQNKLNQIS